GYVAPGVRYADFIAGELESLASAEDGSYWRGVVDGYAPFALPDRWGDDPAPPNAPARATVPLHDLLGGLRDAAARAGVSLKSVLLAAHLKVLSQMTGEDRFFSGLVCHGRPELDGAERVYGMHLNTLPFVYDRTAGTWRDLVRAVFEREVRMWSHRRYPLPAVQRMAGGRRILEVLFNYLEFDQVDSTRVDVPEAVYEAPTEFGLHVSTLDGNLSVTTHTHVLSQVNVVRVAQMHRRVLEAICADLDGDARATYLPNSDRRLIAESVEGRGR